MGVTWAGNGPKPKPTPEDDILFSKFRALETHDTAAAEPVPADPSEQVQTVAHGSGPLATQEMVDHMVRIARQMPKAPPRNIIT